MPRWYTGRDVARPSYYDRDPIPIYMGVNATYTPHGQTLRTSYTPPVGYAAFIETSFMLMSRQAVAGAALMANTQFILRPFWGGGVVNAMNIMIDNTINTYRVVQGTTFGYMAYGDVIEFDTYDGNVGGSVLYVCAAKGTEFLY